MVVLVVYNPSLLRKAMNRESITARRLSSDIGKEAKDWHAVDDLCCRTGDNGAPIALDRWDFFARLWIEPYENIFPQWTYVGEVKSTLVGYLTGCPDTGAFAQAKFWRFSLPLLTDILRGRYSGNQDAQRFVRQFFRFENGPEQAFPRGLHRMLQHDYPAHLHMNVEAGWRGSGVGTMLVEKFFSDLRNTGISAVHLYCGADPLAFYHHRGFNELARIIFHGVPIYALGVRLQN
jgi:GNAT superfamily N-acetyltransferase